MKSTTFIKAGEWYHVIAVKSADAVTLYLNGEAQATTAVADGDYIDNNEANLVVGGSAANAKSNTPSEQAVRIDEVELFSRAVTEDEAKNWYSLGTLGHGALPSSALLSAQGSGKNGTRRVRADQSSDSSSIPSSSRPATVWDFGPGKCKEWSFHFGPITLYYYLPSDDPVVARIVDGKGRSVRSFREPSSKVGLNYLVWGGEGDNGERVMSRHRPYSLYIYDAETNAFLTWAPVPLRSLLHSCE